MADTQISDPGRNPNLDPMIPRTSVSPHQPASIEQPCEETMDAIIYDVSEPLVPPPSSATTTIKQEEHLSPLHRMAEIALATSPNMRHSRPGAFTGSGNASSSEKRESAEEFVLPSQQYYQSGAALLLPSSTAPATQHEDSHANAVAEDQPDAEGDAEDPLNHRYTHFKLQPKNKSPPSFRVVQLKNAPSSSSVGGTGSNPADEDVASYAVATSTHEARNGSTTSPVPAQHTYIDQHIPPFVSAHGDSNQEHVPEARNPPFTDPIPHAHLHPYPPHSQSEEGQGTGQQGPATGSWSAATSPVMSHSHPQAYQAYQSHAHGGLGNGLQPQQHQQNRLSIFDLVAAAEATERESAVFQQQQQQQQEVRGVDATAKFDDQRDVEMNGTGTADIQMEHGNEVNVEGIMNVDVPHTDKKQSTSNRKKTASAGGKKKTGPSAATTTTIPTSTTAIADDTGIIGHIPLRENSRSISKLLWAENGAPAAETQDDGGSASVDVKAEQVEAVPVPTKGKKRQSNGALKSLGGEGDAQLASSSSARSKGKKKTDRVPEEVVEDEEGGAVAETSQPKKKGRKNESSSKSQRKNTKNRSGSLDSTSVADKKANGLGKQKSVQIQDEPEYFEPVAATSARKGRGRAVTPEPIEEEEEEDNTLYCICKKSFSEDSSTMVECDVFCSDTCGVHYALGRLKTNKVKPSQVLKSLSTVIKPEGIAVPITTPGHVNGSNPVALNDEPSSIGLDTTATSASQPFQDRTARARLANAEETAETRRMYEVRKQEIERSLDQLAKRDQFLKRAIEQADALPDLHQVDETEDTGAAFSVEVEAMEVDGKKSKRKKAPKKGKTTVAAEKAAADQRPCGFDLRLVDDDALEEVVAAGDGVDGTTAREVDADVEMRNGDQPPVDRPTTVCLAPRKKCDRHAGWQKLRAADLDLIRGNLTQQLEQVNKRLEACGEPISVEPILVNGTAA
ncbi:hypothetical protein QFC22_004094 [Naganishia vaughanmartiniae]|uniref:Uncharacterized protein n=1 Tax=Naganishia vaughanmartiniae TaxID=1424756 RepID=A0ACC2X3M2_9TREE|nr:hypothetical protein QFC22_004094 [Naganishia vaughanmartiniae]